MRFTHGLLPLLLLTATSLVAAPSSPAADTPPSSPRLTAFSPANAYSNTAAFYALGPKPAASPAAQAAARHILDQLRTFGITNASLDSFESPSPSGLQTFCNVLATIPAAPSAPSPAPLLLLGAHYDTKIGISDQFSGANDSASGVGALLEIARVIALHPLRHEVRLAFFDGEEAAIAYAPNDGFHGSQHLAATMLKNEEIPRLSAMILLDMIGDASFSLTLPANTDHDLRKLALAAATDEDCRSAVSLLPYGMSDDHIAFQQLKVPAIDLIDFEFGSAPGKNDYWHTPADTLDKISPDSLEKSSKIALRIAEALDARLPAPAPADSSGFVRPFLKTGLYAIAILLLLLGILGCLIPALPGPPLAYAALLVLQCHPSHPYSLTFLIISGLLTVIVTIADMIAPSWLTKKAGGSRWGTWGSFLGFLVGLIFFPPFGFLIGCLLGAFLGEILASHLSKSAKKSAPVLSALAAFAGFLLGTGLKLLLCLYFCLQSLHFWH